MQRYFCLKGIVSPTRGIQFTRLLHHKSISTTSSTRNSNASQQQLRKTPKTTRQTNSQFLRRTNRRTAFNKPSEILESLTQKYKIQPVTTFTTCEKYNLLEILKTIDQPVNVLIADEILHFKYQRLYDVLILENGSIVGWGLDEKTVKTKILPLFDSCMISRYDYPESEDMDFIEVADPDLVVEQDNSSHLLSETIIINTLDPEQALLDKAAFASGLSRSTRLAILEMALERYITETRMFTEGLSLGKKLTITESNLLKSTGRLFLLRGKLNLYSELIEIPDLYWSEPNLEAIYKKISSILDISPRISILNKKLDYATDEAKALMQILSEEKGTRLEWIIIILIMIEVGFELTHYFGDKENKKSPPAE